MAKNGRVVSGKTHTQSQRDNYANQHNPNNSEYRQSRSNSTKK